MKAGSTVARYAMAQRWSVGRRGGAACGEGGGTQPGS
jgi:hypothetical protein